MSPTYITPAKKQTAKTAVTVIQSLQIALLRAVQKSRRGLEIAPDIREASLLLESLPLTSDEFGLAANRLRNAHRYFTSGEFGAAAWELRTLRSTLSQN